jgi:hypothetical protein
MSYDPCIDGAEEDEPQPPPSEKFLKVRAALIATTLPPDPDLGRPRGEHDWAVLDWLTRYRAKHPEHVCDKCGGVRTHLKGCLYFPR